MAKRKTKKKVKGKAKTKSKTTRKKPPVGKAARKRAGTTRRKPAKRVAKGARAANKAKTRRTTGKPRPIGARASEATKPPPSRRATPVSSEQRVGVVTHYYSHLSVVVMQLEPGATLRVGERIHIWGHTTDFTQKVESLEVDHAPVAEVGAKDDFGLKVIAHAREHDIVFKIQS
jgi:septum formation inhibitor MinC